MSDALGPLPAQREGQARVMLRTSSGPGADSQWELGHWLSPDAVRERIDAALSAKAGIDAQARPDVAHVMGAVWALVRSGPNFDGRDRDVEAAIAAAIDRAVAAERDRIIGLVRGIEMVRPLVPKRGNDGKQRSSLVR